MDIRIFLRLAFGFCKLLPMSVTLRQSS